jgi:hypothetical protein
MQQQDRWTGGIAKLHHMQLDTTTAGNAVFTRCQDHSITLCDGRKERLAFPSSLVM